MQRRAFFQKSSKRILILKQTYESGPKISPSVRRLDELRGIGAMAGDMQLAEVLKAV